MINIKKANLVQMGYPNLEVWLKNPDHTYIGRTVRYVPGAVQSKWANPFTVQKYGREECLNRYRTYAMQKFSKSELDQLRGKVLGCWCKPDECHGDILVSLLNH